MGGFYYTPSIRQMLNQPVEEFAANVQARQGRSGHAYGVYVTDSSEKITYYEDAMSELGGEPDEEERWRQLIPSELTLKGAYEMERKDPRHRMGDLLTAAFKVYEARRGVGRLGLRPPGFYAWLDALPEWERITMIRDGLVKLGTTKSEAFAVRGDLSSVNLKPSLVKAFLVGVAYLDQAGRQKHGLEILPGGHIKQNGQPFDTTNMRTVFSGAGFAIWVLSPEGAFYAGNHVKGRFHHSSFMGGGAVHCGGEVVARGGRLILLSAKSGHYQPTQEHFVFAIRTLERAGVRPDSFKVVVWRRLQGGQPSVIPASEFLVNSGLWEVWGSGMPRREDWGG